MKFETQMKKPFKNIANRHESVVNRHNCPVDSSLSDLSAITLIENTRALVHQERRVTLAVLDHLAEIERRGLHLARGYGSLHEFALSALGYSSAAAQRRIQSMRAMRDVPTIRPQIQSGELNLSQVAMIQTVARSEKIPVAEKRLLLEQAVAKTTRETEVLLHEQLPENRKLTDKRLVVSAERTELRITLPEESLVCLQNLKHRLAHQIRSQTDSEAIEVILKIAERALRKRDGVDSAPTGAEIAPTRTEIAHSVAAAIDQKVVRAKPKLEGFCTNKPNRVTSQSVRSTPHRRESIPSATIRRLNARAQGQCEYVDLITQKKCTSPFALQVDHRRPVVKEGSNGFENLQILCAHHNHWKGER